MPGVAPPELEGDAAKDQTEQHGDDRRIEGRHDDRVGERKGSEQASPAEDQPSLVAVPDRGDGVHGGVALLPRLEGREQDAETQVEPVHDDVREDREGDDEGPDDGQVDTREHGDVLTRPAGGSGRD